LLSIAMLILAVIVFKLVKSNNLVAGIQGGEILIKGFMA